MAVSSSRLPALVTLKQAEHKIIFYNRQTFSGDHSVQMFKSIVVLDVFVMFIIR